MRVRLWFRPIAVKLKVYAVEILSFALEYINIIVVNADHSYIPRWRGVWTIDIVYKRTSDIVYSYKIKKD